MILTEHTITDLQIDITKNEHKDHKVVPEKRENWVLFVSSIIFGISLMLTFNAKFW